MHLPASLPLRFARWTAGLRRRPERVATIGAPVGLALVVLLMYGPSIRYGLQWDDPAWYLQGAGKSLLELLVPLSTYQFYRPLAIGLNNLLVDGAGIVNAPAAHLLQIVAHLANTLAIIPLLRGLRLSATHARLAALLFALHPYAYQAVAWAAPQQPIATLLTIISILLAQRYLATRQGRYLGLSLGVYAAGLLFQESVVASVWVFAWLALDDWLASGRRRSVAALRRLAWAPPYALLAGLFVLAWRTVPQMESVTGSGFQSEVLAYLVQGVVYPLARVLAFAQVPVTAGQLLMLSAAFYLLVLGLGLRWGGSRAALFAGPWILFALLPTWVGLGWEYVQIGARVLYPAQLGIAVLWAALPAWALSARARLPWRVAGALVLAGVLVVSIEQYVDQDRLAAIGTEHLQSAVEAMSSHGQRRLLFINFPDRLEVRRRPYPYGFWGLTLAPVSQEMADFGRAMAGASVETRSLSAPEYGMDARDASPYRVDMRGVRITHETLADGALWADAVYLSHYAPDGELRLIKLGEIAPDDAAPPVARIADKLELVSAGLQPGERDSEVRLQLVWRPLARAVWGDTFFVHMMDAEGRWVRGADGDALGGMFPLVVWPSGRLLTDWRILDLAGLPAGEYRVTVGAYHRESMERYRAVSVSDLSVKEDEIVVGTLSLP